MYIKRKESSLIYILILTGFFMLLEFSFFIQCNSEYLAVFNFVSRNLNIPITIVPGILAFIAAQISIHLIYAFCLWAVIELIFLFIQPRNKLYYLISIWALSVITILTANQYYFPNSKFTELTSVILFNSQITEIAFFILSGCSIAIILLALAIYILNAFRRRYFFIPGVITLFLLGSTFLFNPESQPYNLVATSSRPNIILIGIDSLRPDFLSYFGHEKPTPFLDSMLEQSSVFAEAVTPLARTFPSWSSILTGQYPREIQIRSNLSGQKQLKLDITLPAILKQHGYETIYATDETRFSNIDRNFGFDQVISPPMGLNDFLLGNFNDFPLTNLMVNTRPGKWLFPYSYANRPVHFTYDPDSFLNLLKPVLQQERNQSLFLAVHFCLTHAPYVWADKSGKNVPPQTRYVESIVRVDKQISGFMAMLEKNHLLDHAIVVLLSDHGEALEFRGDRITEKELYRASSASVQVPKFYPEGLEKEEVNQSAGHGTDVMGLPQYHTLLAFKSYGAGEFQTGNIAGVVSLLDIKPTLLELLNIPVTQSSGVSLAKSLQGKIKVSDARHIFLESDYSPSSIRTVYPEIRKVMLEGIEIFEINPQSTRLTVKNDMANKIIASKQFADIHGEWMLALYPQKRNQRMPILINLNNGLWTNDLNSELAIHSPVGVMLQELRKFYGNEIGAVS